MIKLNGYTLEELASLDFNVEPTEELRQTFIERTKTHIARVIEYGKKLNRDYSNHDSSKLTSLLDGYCFFSKPQDERTTDENFVLDIATYLHITQTPHHPEFWTNTDLSGFTRKTPTPNGIVIATDMPNDFLEEMVVDWKATGDEKGNTVRDWFNQVNGVRWLFDQTQINFIRDVIRKLD